MPTGDKTTKRVKAAFAEAEREGLTIALWARLGTVVAVQIWWAIAIPRWFMVFYHAFLLLFLLLGVTQLLLLNSRHGARWQAYVFAVLDGILLGAVLLLPNPLQADPPPPEMILRYANIIFVFVLLAGTALSYNPGLVLCTGLSTIAVWRLGVFLLASREGAITSADPAWLNADSMTDWIGVFLDPAFIHLTTQNKKVFVVLLVTAVLAFVVSRARRMVQRQVTFEQARTNLARYFSPNLVDQLAGQDQPLGAVRRQSVAVLFADIQGFTSLSETMAPEDVVNLLRGFHERMETA
ncbi:MAG: adenylate/guanylate cyclase domain-containing protein, partial [Geminicoccaceae bacterium]